MYKIFLTEKAAKFLEKLSKSNLNKFTQKINLVAKNPQQIYRLLSGLKIHPILDSGLEIIEVSIV